jgi:hypothetical protein
MTSGSRTRAWASGILAVVGGVLMVASGYGSRSFLLAALNIAESDIPQYLGGIAGLTASLAVSIVAFLIALGGLTVVLGGCALLARHRTAGRLLIMLGGGAGFLGLLVTFGYAAVRLGLTATLAYAPYWLGLVFAVVGRRLAKGM